MNSLVADYGTSSESESEKSNAEEIVTESSKNDTQTLKLPKPDFDGSSSKKSVFSNPFVEAENAKKAILEKHVKMVPTKDKVDMINGKKICWNYRKGRCHFGHNCTFAHDTDLQKSKDDGESESQTQPTPTSENSGSQGSRPIQVSGISQSDEGPSADVEDKWENQTSNRKKRPGLTPGLVPSKKVMMFYKKTKDPK